jgi:hypothetical protein
MKPIQSIHYRWLALMTCGVASLACAFSFGPYLVLVPAPLLLGTMLEPRFRKTGRCLVWTGALLLTIFVIPIGVIRVSTIPAVLWSNREFSLVGITLLWALAIALVGWSDARLFGDASQVVKRRLVVAAWGTGVLGAVLFCAFFTCGMFWMHRFIWPSLLLIGGAAWAGVLGFREMLRTARLPIDS